MKRVFCIVLTISLVIYLVFMTGCERKSGSQSAAQTSPQAPLVSQTSPLAYTISVGGSTSVTPLMELFQAEYEKNNSTIKITISGTGSGDGIKGAAEGTYEIGMSSRELTPAEIGTGLESIIVAIDGIAVIINSANPVSSLTMEQIKNIYIGAITRWEQLGTA
ncbi:MAG: substrate-binding domain-containing protein, partial [Treponema sp.]|nr:substrate-binding domain-containing protein [Treponema sp.]